MKNWPLLGILILCITFFAYSYFFNPGRYYYDHSGESNILFKVDRFTGKVYRMDHKNGGWMNISDYNPLQN